MLQQMENVAYANGLKGRVLGSATLLREQTPQEWLCHSGNHMIVVRWQQGVLGIGVGESEHETYSDIKIVAMDYKRTKEDTQIKFNEIKTFMNWDLDDQVCLDL